MYGKVHQAVKDQNHKAAYQPTTQEKIQSTADQEK